MRPLLRAKPTDLIRLQVSLDAPEAAASAPGMLYTDQLLLITTAIHQLRKAGCSMEISVDKHLKDYGQDPYLDSRLRYAGRVNFFRLLQLEEPLCENFNRRPGRDRFIEITPYDRDNYIEVGRKVVQIVVAHARIDRAVQQMLDFCLFEIMDNVLIHAAYPQPLGGQGWCSAQYFPVAREIRLIIADMGIGIHQALTSPPGSKFRGLSEEQALRKCVEKGVTNGEGMGFGLYATLAFILQNEGELLIYSGSHYGTLHNGQFRVKSGAYWQGTVVYLKIRTDKAVDYRAFMPADYPLAADFDFFYGEKSEKGGI